MIILFLSYLSVYLVQMRCYSHPAYFLSCTYNPVLLHSCISIMQRLHPHNTITTSHNLLSTFIKLSVLSSNPQPLPSPTHSRYKTNNIVPTELLNKEGLLLWLFPYACVASACKYAGQYFLEY